MKFKENYNVDCAAVLAKKIQQVYPLFNSTVFIRSIQKHIDDKALFARLNIFADALEICLPNDYAENINIFTAIVGPELQQETGMYQTGWWLWPFGRYVERHGIENIHISFNFICELTKRFTGEFAIRPLLENRPKETMKMLIHWSKDKNVHVRRLASEGARISLPWSKKLYTALDEFKSYTTLLSNLKDDRSKFVQRSVGNNLNDLYKQFPAKAMEIITAWKKAPLSKEAAWIIQHGLRSIKSK